MTFWAITIAVSILAGLGVAALVIAWVINGLYVMRQMSYPLFPGGKQ